jgi:integrase
MTRKRRGRGEGSVHQRTSDGLWIASVSYGYDDKGNRKRMTANGRTKAEAQEKLKGLQQRDASHLGKAEQLTVHSYLIRWLEIVKPTVEPNTYRPYERHVRLHISPFLGHVKLAKLAPVDIEQFYATLANKEVSAALARKIGTTLTIALGEAVRLRLRFYNPAKDVRKPKAVKPEISVFDSNQMAAFLRAAADDRLYAYYVLALDTGARPGELFALGWEDFDFNACFVQIRRSLEEIDGRLRIKEVKTPKGRRRIDLAPFTLAALNEHRKAMLAEGHQGGPVFCNTIGTWLRIGDVTRNSLKPILARAQLRGSLYTLRHTCATMLLSADEPAKVVSERLGHSTITLTLDTYSHVLPTMQKRAAATMNKFLGQVGTKLAIC